MVVLVLFCSVSCVYYVVCDVCVLFGTRLFVWLCLLLVVAYWCFGFVEVDDCLGCLGLVSVAVGNLRSCG